MKKNIRILPLVLVLLFAICIFSSCQSTPAPFREIEKLLGTPCEKILSDKTFTVKESILGITTVKKETEKVFGVAGEIEIFLMSDDENVEIITWQSTGALDKTEIDAFVDGMKNSYGSIDNSSDTTGFMWDNIFLKTENNEIYVVFTNDSE